MVLEENKKIRLMKAKNALLQKKAQCVKGFGKEDTYSAYLKLQREKELVQQYINYKRLMDNEEISVIAKASFTDDRANLLSREFHLNTFVGEDWQALSYMLRTYMFEVVCIEEFLGILIPKNEFIQFFGDVVEPMLRDNSFDKGFPQKTRNKWLVKLFYDKKEEKVPLLDEQEYLW